MSTEPMAIDDVTRPRRIGLLGYGEVGRILAEDLPREGLDGMVAYDAKVGTPDEVPLREHAGQHGVELGESTVVFRDCDLVISAVTASQTVDAALACSPHMGGKWFVDLNSASPGAKISASGLVQREGGRYVEVAVMSTVAARRLRVPLILGGEHADAAAAMLRTLEFNVTEIASRDFGIAAATKLCRSIMIKGMEALTLECYSAARAWGVEDTVLESLSDTFPQTDFEHLGNYFFQRAMLHGKRRAEEMREASKTIEEVNLPAWMAQASSHWQDWIADKTQQYQLDQVRADTGDWRGVVDALLSRRASEKNDK